MLTKSNIFELVFAHGSVLIRRPQKGALVTSRTEAGSRQAASATILSKLKMKKIADYLYLTRAMILAESKASVYG